MASNPTKILAYDLDPELGKLIGELTQFTGSYTSLYERLMNLTPDTFDPHTQAVIENLIAGYENGGVHIVQRLEQVRMELMYESGTFNEVFTYDPTYGNVVKHETTGSKNVTVVYNYADMAAGKLSTSVQTSLNTKGDTVKVTKTYTYDADENITSIATATAITPAAPAV